MRFKIIGENNTNYSRYITSAKWRIINCTILFMSLYFENNIPTLFLAGRLCPFTLKNVNLKCEVCETSTFKTIREMLLNVWQKVNDVILHYLKAKLKTMQWSIISNKQKGFRRKPRTTLPNKLDESLVIFSTKKPKETEQLRDRGYTKKNLD